MKIVFIGAVKFSERALKKLIDIEAEVVGVCTLEYSSFNADHVNLTPLCRAHEIPVRYTPKINLKESIEWIQSHSPDIIFCFGWSRLLKTDLLNLAPLGVVGYHPAALPANRGRHPLIWALVLGLAETASTFFFMDESADSGDILSQRQLKISGTDDAAMLYQRMIKTALEQIEEFVPALASGNFQRIPQDHSKANTWRKRGSIDGKIDWRMSARSIHNLVRGLTKPYVGAHFEMNGKEIKVWKTEIIGNNTRNIEPGKVLSVDVSGAIIKAGEYSIRLIRKGLVNNIQKGDYL